MEGYSPKIPFTKDSVDGSYLMNRTALDSIKQDFKMLILTNPGERIMLPNYGVGIRQLLFSQNSNSLRSEIRERIKKQVKEYMSFVEILDINIETTTSNENSFYISITYKIPSLNSLEELNLSLGSN